MSLHLSPLCVEVIESVLPGKSSLSHSGWLVFSPRSFCSVHVQQTSGSPVFSNAKDSPFLCSFSAEDPGVSILVQFQMIFVSYSHIRYLALSGLPVSSTFSCGVGTSSVEKWKNCLKY